MSLRSLWLRLQRVRAQSRIRLPAAPPRGNDVQVGDRLQIGSRLWRVAEHERHSTAVRLQLCAEDGSGSAATLTIDRGAWRLEGGQGAVNIDSTAVLHFALPEGHNLI